MAYRSRLRSGTYTDSDIKAFYIENRYEFGPFIREVGDFVAHPTRDKGDSFDAAIGIYSQVAFYQRYQGKAQKPLNPIGECEWWLKPYFARKVEILPPRMLKKALGMSKSELKKKINSWFPCKERFPKTIEALNPFELSDVVNFFSRTINNNAAFQAGEVKGELKKALKAIAVESVCVDDFLVGTATILNGMKVELAEGVIASVSIRVGNQRYTKVPVGDLEPFPRRSDIVVIHPDGPLEITIQTKSPKEHNLVDVSTPLLNTEIDTESYFDRSLIHYPHPKSPQLNLEQELQFASDATPKVTTC